MVPDMGGGVQGFVKLVLACQWAETAQLVPGQQTWICKLWDYGFHGSSVCLLVGEAASETRAGFLEGREGDGGCTLGILGLVSSHWCVELGPEPSGGQGCV